MQCNNAIFAPNQLDHTECLP